MNLALIFILLVVFVNYMGMGLIYPIFASLLFDTSLGFVPAEATSLFRGFVLGVLLALMPLMQFFFSPYLGKKSDQIGRKKILTTCLALSTVGYLVSVWGIYTHSLLAMVIFRVLLGISGASVAIVQAILIDMSSDNKAKNLSLFNMAMGAGYALGPFIGGFFSSDNALFKGSIVYPFIFGLLFTVLNLSLVKKYFYETKKTDRPISYSKLSFNLKSPQIRNLFACTFIFSFGWSFFFEFLPVFLIGQYEYNPFQIGNFYGYASLFYMLSSGFLVQPLISKIKSQSLLLLSLILSGVYLLLFYCIGNPSILWFYVPILAYLVSIVFPTTSYLMSNLTDKDKQGRALGSLVAVQSIAFAISPLFSGFLVGIHHGTPIFLGALAFIFAGVLYGYQCWSSQDSTQEEFEDIS